MPRLATIVAALLLLMAAALPAHAQIYVDKDATGDNNGTSWTDAYTDLQTAIDNALSTSEIWIAEGVYKPDSEDDSFTITGAKDGVELYGGFEGGANGETSRPARNPGDHPTVLSGDVGGDDNTNANGVTLTAEDIIGFQNNADHVLLLDGTLGGTITTSTVIDGLTLTAGQADGTGLKFRGGGLLCDGSGSNNECSPVLRNLVFAGNDARDGGAMYNNARDGGTARPRIENAILIGNTAKNGGAAYNAGSSSPQITGVTVADNSASDRGGAIYNGATSSATATPSITNTILWANSASEEGDEMYNLPGSGGAGPSLSHTIIEGGVNGPGVGGKSNENGGGNVDAAPRFADAADPDGADGTFATQDDGFNTSAGSPALDAGSNAALPSEVDQDLTGHDRTQDLNGDGTATVNIGAYEVLGRGSPLTETSGASNIVGTAATLTGTVVAVGVETVVKIQLYPTADPAAVRTISVSGSPFSGVTEQDVTVRVSGLTPSTRYALQLTAHNDKGADQGQTITFTTTTEGYVRRIKGTDGTGNDAGWRMLALPAASKTRAALEGDLTFSTNSGSILYDWISGAWSPLEHSSDALPRGTGFMLYFFDDVIDPIDAEGLPLAVGTGSEDQSVDKTVDGLSTGETFHLLGNPFDVAFDLSELNLSDRGFQKTVQIWDPASESYTAVTQGNAGDEIAAWQGFFVERDPNASTDGTSLTFSTAGKQSGPGTIIGGLSAAVADAKRNDEQRLRLGLRLAVTDTTEGDTEPPSPQTNAAPTRETPDSLGGATAAAKGSDGAQADTIGTGRLGLLLSEDAKSGWDAYEASRLGPPGGGEAAVALSSPLKRSGQETPVQRALASEPYPGESAAVTLPVSVQTNGAGSRATIRLPKAQRERVPPGWSVRLTDTKTGEQADLLGESYRFTPREGEGTELQSPPESRFQLAVGPRSALPVTDGLALEAPYPNPASRQVTVEYAVPQKKASFAQLQLYDVLGRRVRTARVKPGPRTRRLDVSGLASGVYVLRLVANGAQQTRKLTVVR